MLLPNFEELVSLKNIRNPLGLGARVKVISPMQGDHASPFKGRGLDFSEFREYAPGDDIRSIDWRVTARTGRAHTKVFTEERERSVFVIVDINSYMDFGTRRTFKSIQAARAAAIIAWRANGLHDKTGAILFGHIPDRVRFLPAKRSRKAIWQMLKILCSPAASNSEVKAEEALTIANKCVAHGSSVFIISDFFNISSEFEKQLGLLSKRCDITLVRIIDPADKSIPQVDEIQFSNSDNRPVLVNTNDRECAERYRELWAASESMLKGINSNVRGKIVEIATDRDVAADLFRDLNSSSKRRRL